MTKDEALKQALEALEESWHLTPKPDYVRASITTIKEVLAQPEQEPVKMVAYNCTCGRTMKFESVHGVVAPQRTWVGLTDEEFQLIYDMGRTPTGMMEMVEAKLKEKNNG